MKRHFYRIAGIVAACTLFASALHGQQRSLAQAVREGSNLRVSFTLDGSDSLVTANEQLTITPVVTDGRQSAELAPVVFTGRIRQKVNERLERLYGTAALPSDAFNVEVKSRRKGARSFVYSDEVPFRPWMAGASVMLRREVSGCAGSRTSLDPLMLARIADPVKPRLSFALPDDEPVKRRSERITAVVHFPQGRSVLLRTFADNASQLARIDSLTARVLDADSLSVERFYLKGYASPEDTYAFNTRLSANRVRSMREYLQERFALQQAPFVTETEPEDWDSLRRWVVVSDLPARDRILAVIDTISDPDARDGAIRSIDGGKTYLTLLNGVYPQLRRVDYRIDILLPPFSEEQCAELIYTRPEWLSLGEMCRLAQSYPLDAPQRAYVCAVALEHYPDDPCACNNMAMLALDCGDVQAARKYLDRCGGDPRALNNLGVLALFEGDRQQALRCFTLAAENGSEEAAFNLAHFPDLAIETVF